MCISWDTWCKIVHPTYVKYYDQSVLFSGILLHEYLKKLKSLTTRRRITLFWLSNVYLALDMQYITLMLWQTLTVANIFSILKVEKLMSRQFKWYMQYHRVYSLWDFTLQWNLNTMARGRGIQQVVVQSLLWSSPLCYEMGKQRV